MLLALDVDYRSDAVQAAYVRFHAWTAPAPADEGTMTFAAAAAPYESGQFFRRELEYLAQVVDALAKPSLIVIDGYVWLGEGRPGLGMHLYRQLEEKIPIVGVAKRPFRDNAIALPVLRGESRQPLFVTAIGLTGEEAAGHVRAMAGAHRIPTLLKRVDQLTRTAR